MRLSKLSNAALGLMAGFVIMNANCQAEHAVTAAAHYADLPLTLTSFGAARLDDKVYVYGGHTGEAHSYSNKEQSNQLLCLDLQNPEAPWKAVAESERLQGLALVAYKGKIIRIGGFSALNEEGEEHVLKSTDQVAAFDTATGEWSAMPSLPEPRSSHDAVLFGSKIYVVGGWQLDGGSNDSKWHDNAYCLDLESADLEWQALAKPPFQRRAISIVPFGEQLAVIGGMEPENKIVKDTMLYDPASDLWTKGPELIGEGRMTGFGTAAIALPNAILVSTIDGNLQKLDANAHSWTSVGKTTDARFFHELIRIDDQHAIVIGGANMESGKFVETELIKMPQ